MDNLCVLSMLQLKKILRLIQTLLTMNNRVQLRLYCETLQCLCSYSFGDLKQLKIDVSTASVVCMTDACGSWNFYQGLMLNSKVLRCFLSQGSLLSEESTEFVCFYR